LTECICRCKIFIFKIYKICFLTSKFLFNSGVLLPVTQEGKAKMSIGVTVVSKSLLMNIDELSAFLQIPKCSIYNLRLQKRIPYRKIFGLRFNIKEINIWLHNHRVGPETISVCPNTQLLTICDVSQMTQIAVKTLYNNIYSIPHFKFGNYLRFGNMDIRQWMHEHKTEVRY